MSTTSPDPAGARARLLEALEAYLDAVKAAAVQAIESRSAPDPGELRVATVATLLEASSAATTLAAALLGGANALPPELILAPAAQAAIAGALVMPPETSRECAKQLRAQTAGIILPAGRS